MRVFSPPHNENDASRTPPFPLAARRNILHPNSSTSPQSTINKNILTPSQVPLSVQNQSHTLVPGMSVPSTMISTNPTTSRIQPAIVPGRTQILGENGVLVQGPGGIVSANGAYIPNAVPSQFGHGTNIAVSNGEEGNNNLMWLLDFKLDFFNDQEAGKSQFQNKIQIEIFFFSLTLRSIDFSKIQFLERSF